MIRNCHRQLLSLASALLLGAAAAGVQAERATAAENTTAAPKRITIMSAGFYGYRPGEGMVGRGEWDAVERALRQECNGKASCSVTASNNWFRSRDNRYGDPAPNQQKRAEIRYRCTDGASGAYEFIPEGQTRALSCGT
jgi:hypothetical protein